MIRTRLQAGRFPPQLLKTFLFLVSWLAWSEGGVRQCSVLWLNVKLANSEGPKLVFDQYEELDVASEAGVKWQETRGGDTQTRPGGVHSQSCWSVRAELRSHWVPVLSPLISWCPAAKWRTHNQITRDTPNTLTHSAVIIRPSDSRQSSCRSTLCTPPSCPTFPRHRCTATQPTTACCPPCTQAARPRPRLRLRPLHRVRPWSNPSSRPRSARRVTTPARRPGPDRRWSPWAAPWARRVRRGQSTLRSLTGRRSYSERRTTITPRGSSTEV